MAVVLIVCLYFFSVFETGRYTFKAICRAQDHTKSTSALSQQQNCQLLKCQPRITVKQKCLQFCSKSINGNIGRSQRCKKTVDALAVEQTA